MRRGARRKKGSIGEGEGGMRRRRRKTANKIDRLTFALDLQSRKQDFK